MEEISPDDLAMLRDVDARARAATAALRAAEEGSAPVGVRSALSRSDQENGRRAIAALAAWQPGQRYDHLCAGWCGRPTERRGWECADCGALRALGNRRAGLAAAVATVPELDWCRVETEKYVESTAGIRARALTLPAGPERELALDLVERARWRRSTGSVLILGATDEGKSMVAIAIAHRLLDRALSGYPRPIDDDAFRFARGTRFATGIELGLARSQHKLGDGDAKPVQEAMDASLLVLDEVGYERDAETIRDVLYARYGTRAGTVAVPSKARPTIITSGRTLDELNERYGNASVRRLPTLGHVIDLHPRGVPGHSGSVSSR